MLVIVKETDNSRLKYISREHIVTIEAVMEPREDCNTLIELTTGMIFIAETISEMFERMYPRDLDAEAIQKKMQQQLLETLNKGTAP